MTSDPGPINYSMDDITKIIQELTRHSLENPCTHSFDQIMESIFDT